jgi:hypothetical protein
MAILFSVVFVIGIRKVETAPLCEFSKPGGRRQSDRARDVQLYAGPKRDSSPQRARERLVVRRFLARIVPRLTKRATNLLERPAGLLHCLHSKQLFEVAGGVVIAATQPKGWRDQTFLDVVPYGPA